MKKIIPICLLIVATLVSLSLTGCTGELEPLSNAEIFDSVESKLWKERAVSYYDTIPPVVAEYPLIPIEKLTTGTDELRPFQLIFNFNLNNLKGREYVAIKFTVKTDRDVTTGLSVSADVISEKVIAKLVNYEFKKGVEKTITISFDTNYTEGIGGIKGLEEMVIDFWAPYDEYTDGFREWTETKYIISNFEIYGGESSVANKV